MADHQPLDCIRAMTDLARNGKIMTVEFWIHETHVQLWCLETISAMRGFGSTPMMAQDEMDQYVESLRDLCTVLGCADDSKAMLSGPASNVVLQMLIKQLMNWAIEIIRSGEIVDIITQIWIDATKTD